MNNLSLPYTSSIIAHVIRLVPDMDLKKEIIAYLTANKIKAAFIMTCVGSLKKINIRLATGLKFMEKEDKFEIISLVGCISIDRCHIHIGISDDIGNAFGGHLLDGCLVYTTAEIVIGELPQLNFNKAVCEKSGWEELIVNKGNNENK